MEEHRRSPRLRTLKGGLIIFGTAPAFDCVIRNMSQTGAMIAVNPFGIPDDFTLIIKPEMRKQPSHIVWRAADKMGVSFV